MIEVGQIRQWSYGQARGKVFLIIEVPDLVPDGPWFAFGWVRYLEDGRECLDKIEWIEQNSVIAWSDHL